MNEKIVKKEGKNVLIVMLILIIIGLFGFIFYDKVIDKKKETKYVEEKVTKKEEKEEENLDEVAQKIVNKLETYRVDYFDEFENVDFKNMDDKDSVVGAFVYSQSKNSNADFKRQDVEEYYLNLFGKKLDNYPNLECHVNDGILYRYDNVKKEYVKDCGNNDSCHAHGGRCISNSLFIKYSNIEKIENNYIVTVTKVYAPAQGMCLESPENAFYADSKYTVKIDGLSQFTSTDDMGIYITDKDKAKSYYEQNYEGFKNIKPNYRYTFEKINGDFYLTKLETIK